MEHRSPIRQEDKLTILSSSCLLGNKVRYNGEAKTQKWMLHTLGKYAHFISLCPELAMGLGVPRETLHLRAGGETPRLFTKSGKDLTEQAHASNLALIAQLPRELDGIILTSQSPSCGLQRVKVYDRNHVPQKNGTGLFAANVQEAFPLVPIIESGQLSDLFLRERFLMQVYTMQRFRKLEYKAQALQSFHRQHKFLLRMFDQSKFRTLGQMVANARKETIKEDFANYRALLYDLLQSKIKRGNVVDSLVHMYGFIKDELASEHKHQILRTITAYQKGYLGFASPSTLIRFSASIHKIEYLQDQAILDPYPEELGVCDNF